MVDPPFLMSFSLSSVTVPESATVGPHDMGRIDVAPMTCLSAPLQE